MNIGLKKSAIALLSCLCIFSLTACGTMESVSKQKNEKAQITATDSAEASSIPSKPYEAKITLQKGYRDDKQGIHILGLKEYKKLKGKDYTDKAPKGTRYLVLFLEISNYKNVKDYFNVDNVTAAIDGKKITNTYLLNDPEGYSTIFSNIEAKKTIAGFAAWKVPENWKKLSLQYTGWNGSDNLDITMKLTRKDLKNPEKYNAQYYESTK